MERPGTKVELADADEKYAQARLEEALLAYQDVIQQDPDSAWSHSRIGAILAQRGDAAGAEHALNRALELDPTLPQAHSNLGNIYYARGDYEAALDKYKQAVVLSPDTAVFHQNAHAAYKKLGKMAEAITSLKHAHRLDRQDTRAEVKERLGNVRKQVGGRVGCTGVITLLVLAAVTASLL